MTTFLYIKQCDHCGLKYFGKTTKKNPYSYYGSGLVWQKHYKKYGKSNIKTLEIFSFEDINEAQKFALDFSEKNNIINSKEWANLISEDGVQGFPNNDKNPMFNSKRFGKKNPFFGKKHTEETKKIIKEKRKNQIITEETKKKMSERITNSIWINDGKKEKIIFKFEKIPDNFKKGRLPFSKERIEKMKFPNPTGKKYFNDGIKNYMVFPEKANPEWSTGMIKRKIKL